MIKVYEVGGSIRDELLGLKPKDFDYAIEASSWEEMKTWVYENNDQVFLETPEFFTIRALKGRQVRDYVLCRKETSYSDMRHPDSVEVGSLRDDILRRDFGVGALARDIDTREILDPSGQGLEDIRLRQIRCVGSTTDRLTEDPLRLLRALRFHITKGLSIHYEILEIMTRGDLVEGLTSVSTNQIREELHKCFAFDTVKTFTQINNLFHQDYIRFIFKDIWLKPTMESH